MEKSRTVGDKGRRKRRERPLGAKKGEARIEGDGGAETGIPGERERERDRMERRVEWGERRGMGEREIGKEGKKERDILIGGDGESFTDINKNSKKL